MATIESKKLAFVHIPKTGGISLVNALGMKPDGHFRASEYPSDYDKFAIIRHPIERFESMIAYMKNIENMFHKTIPSCYKKYKTMPIDEIADKFYKDNELIQQALFKPQIYFLNDMVLLFRSVNDAFKTINYMYGLKRKELPLEMNKSIKKEILKNTEPVEKFYNSDFMMF